MNTKSGANKYVCRWAPGELLNDGRADSDLGQSRSMDKD